MAYGSIADKKTEIPNKKRSIGYGSGYGSGFSSNLALGSGTLGSGTFLTSGHSSGLGISPTYSGGYAPSYAGIYSGAVTAPDYTGPNYSGPPISAAPIYTAPAVAVSAPIQTVTRNIIQTVPQPVPVDRPYPVPQPYPVVYTKSVVFIF